MSASPTIITPSDGNIDSSGFMNTVSQTLANLKNNFNKNFLIAGVLSLIIWFSVTWLINWLYNKYQNNTIIVEDKNVNPTCQGSKGYEVFNVINNSNWLDSENICARYESKLATLDQLKEAQKDGANWCSLGWLSDQSAFYPTQQAQVDKSSDWPLQFRNGCGQVGLNGGIYPPELKLSVNCYGLKPTDHSNINPWNTVNGQWSKYK